jgi:hypothetical protein
MEVEIDASGIDRLAQNLQRAQPLVQTEMASAMQRSTLAVQADAMPRVNVITGNTRRSITQTVSRGAGMVEGRVGTNVKHGRILEEGRGPVDAGPGRVLRFTIGGQVLFRRRVGPAAPRPYLRPALAAMRGRIRTEFAQVPRRVLAKL